MAKSIKKGWEDHGMALDNAGDHDHAEPSIATVDNSLKSRSKDDRKASEEALKDGDDADGGGENTVKSNSNRTAPFARSRHPEIAEKQSKNRTQRSKTAVCYAELLHNAQSSSSTSICNRSENSRAIFA